MIKHTLIKKFLTVLMLSASLIYFGCEKKAEKTEQPKEEVTAETVMTDSTGSTKTNEPAAEEMIQIPDIKGTWTGTFDGKLTTLNITEQTDSSFSGKITINYKQTLNQDVKGNFSPTTLKISMVDQLHSKYMKC